MQPGLPGAAAAGRAGPALRGERQGGGRAGGALPGAGAAVASQLGPAAGKARSSNVMAFMNEGS